MEKNLKDSEVGRSCGLLNIPRISREKGFSQASLSGHIGKGSFSLISRHERNHFNIREVGGCGGREGFSDGLVFCRLVKVCLEFYVSLSSLPT